LRKDDAGKAPRIPAIDIARGVAIVGMVIFHFTRDLEMFAFVRPGLTVEPGWALFARLVAGSFLFLSGVSLVLAHRSGIRWPAFWRRFVILAAAAALVSAATFAAMPVVFVFYGILHSVAVSSLVGLAFLRAPPLLTALVAAGVWTLPHYWRSEVFDGYGLAWTGLAAQGPPSIDFVPLFPWLAPLLLGIAAARAFPVGRLAALGSLGRPGAVLAWAGRTSLVIYLVHQPVLVAILAAVSRLMAPS
jgi:uncharacterized membrane protein